MRRLILTLAGVVLVPVGALAQTGQAVEYYHTDVLGSVRAVTNAQGQVISRHDVTPFGEEVAPGSPPAQTRLFTGKERDAETGLDYFGARYYRQDLGRFTSVDPILIAERLGDPQSVNRYAYARNNPLKYIDVDGLSYILYSRADQKLYLFDKNNVLQGIYDAANNVIPGWYELRDGVYPFEHTDKARLGNPKDDDRFTVDGSYGPYGIFHVKDFWGADSLWHEHIGLHSGRLSQGGYWVSTHGCIRTTDDAMAAITSLAKDDPLTDLIVQNGSVLTVRPVVVSITISFVWLPGIGGLVPVITSVTVSQ